MKKIYYILCGIIHECHIIEKNGCKMYLERIKDNKKIIAYISQIRFNKKDAIILAKEEIDTIKYVIAEYEEKIEDCKRNIKEAEESLK